MNENNAKEFLLEEYRRFAELFLTNEKAGEKRLTFYITLSAAVIGAIVKLYTGEDNIDTCYQLLVMFLVLTSINGLLLVGCVIWRRLHKRNEVTDLYKIQMDNIRKTLIKLSENTILNDYQLNLPQSKREFTSLKDIVFLINCIVTIFLIAIVCFDIKMTDGIILKSSCAVICLPALVCQIISVKHYFIHYFIFKATHAGCVAYKMEQDEKKFLIINAKNKLDDWVLPKGHIEHNENNRLTAWRELKEETGYKGNIGKSLGCTKKYIANDEEIKVEYFLTKVAEEDKISVSEGRNFKWVTLDEAIDKVQHQEAKDILKKIRNF